MDPLPIRTIVEVTGGRWLAAPATRRASEPPADVLVDAVSTDSRTLESGDLFVPIRGDTYDGHAFVANVAARAVASFAAEGAVDTVTRALGATSFERFGLVVVDDTLAALQRLAAWYRARLGATVIGVTGSNGKTTVKEFIGQLLGGSAETVRARRSFNNALGVALTILDARCTTRYLVAEVGTNAPGEIASLARLVRPHRAVVTGVAAAHLAGLGDLDGVAREKAALFEALPEDGVAFLPLPVACEDRFTAAASRAGARLVRFGEHRLDTDRPQYGLGACEPMRRGDGMLEGYRFEIDGRELQLRVPGPHNVRNALAAVAVARELGVSWSDLQEAVAGLRLPPLRVQLERAGGVTVIDDTYNANPSSVAAALETARDCAGGVRGRWHLVLGDLLELGPESRERHRQLGETIGRCGVFDHIWAIGADAAVAAAASGLPSSLVEAGPVASLVDELAVTLRPGDGVLLKASRGVALDRVAARLREALRARTNPAMQGAR